MAFLTGAIPAPPHRLIALEPFQMPRLPPDQFGVVPARLSAWGNDQYGDCVSAEEAFRCACDNPEDFIPDQTVISWARQHGFLEGAMLPDVMDAMKKDGFQIGANRYNCGDYKGVDYSNEDVLRSALTHGPVKIAIDHSALPSGAGNKQGWFGLGGRPGEYRNSDHCVSILAFGPASYLYGLLKLPVPDGVKPDELGYLLYTWTTIGFVDHAWIMSTTTEAYVRVPPTVIDGPQPQPSPYGPDPMPDPTPTPVPPPKPEPWWMETLVALLPVLLPIIIQLLQQLLKKSAEWKQQYPTA